MKRLLVVIILFGIALTGCSQSDNTSVQSNEVSVDSNVESGVMPQEQQADYAERGEIEEEFIAPFSERMVIYEGYLSLEIKDVEESEQFIQEQLKKHNGYLVESNKYNRGEENVSATIVAKIPQASFETFLTEIEAISIAVLERRVSGNDVTEEYVDLEARLRSKEVVEKRLLSFMEEATQTEALLKISNDLATVQQEIEQIKGRMKYLENNVNFSTLTIELQEKNITVSSLNNREALNTWLKTKSLFMNTVNGLLTFFSTIVVLILGLSPVLLPLVGGFAVFFVLKRRKKRTPNDVDI